MQENTIRLIAATRNQGKLREFQELARDFPLRITGPGEEGQEEEIEESGASFDENALIKARAVHLRTGGWVMADDSGLCVEALGGAPGIHTARYAGEGASDQDNIFRLLEEMAELPEGERQASFCCSLAVIGPDGRERIYRGKTEGIIAGDMFGSGGFGYDPVFIPLGYERTLAQMTAEEKNELSHRGRAFRLFLEEMD